jgi:hypothetical protein
MAVTSWVALGAVGVVGGVLVLGLAQDRKAPPVEDYVKVEVRGKLEHGVVAIGGESTGTEVTAKDITWELSLGKSEEHQRVAAEQNGKTVLVTGTLTRKKGTERKERWIVEVATLKPAPAK